MYTNDMNGDGLSTDLMYIPRDDSEIQFKTEADRVAFWQFVEQDDYLRTHKGQYAEPYSGRAPWLHRVDLRLAEDFSIRIGKTTQKFQASVDIINFGNMLNSSWGIPKNADGSNNGRILKYEGTDAQMRPIFSMYDKSVKNTYDTYMSYSNCWSLQVGLKYFFN